MSGFVQGALLGALAGGAIVIAVVLSVDSLLIALVILGGVAVVVLGLLIALAFLIDATGGGQ